MRPHICLLASECHPCRRVSSIESCMLYIVKSKLIFVHRVLPIPVNRRALELFAHFYTRITYFPANFGTVDTTSLMAIIFESKEHQEEGLPQMLLQSDGFLERLLNFLSYAIRSYFKDNDFPGVLLWQMLRLIAALVETRPDETCEFLRSRTPDNHTPLIEYMASACQWQFCTGSQTPLLAIAESLERYLLIMRCVKKCINP